MIVNFTVENFKSIKDPQLLEFLADSSTHRDDMLVSHEDRGDIKLLPALFVYGGNASGKTNLCKAVEALQWITARSAYFLTLGEKIPHIEPFRLDPITLSEPTKFGIQLLVREDLWEYRLSVDQVQVHSESLRRKANSPKSRWSLVFDRTGPDRGKWIGNAPRLNAELFRSVRDNSTVLSKAALENVAAIEGVFAAIFAMKVSYLGFDSEKLLRDAAETLVDTDSLSKYITRIARCAELSFESIQLFPQGTQFGDKLSAENIRFSRRRSDGQRVDFRIGDVSEGTKRYIALSVAIFNAMVLGRLLVLDEFDASLHPLLAQEVRNLVTDADLNCTGAQFVFATHNDTLLDSFRLRRDQIVLLDQTSLGATHWNSMADLDRLPRPDESFQKRYLNGGYGGVPRIGDLRAVFLDFMNEYKETVKAPAGLGA